jgi:hypothetical protein
MPASAFGSAPTARAGYRSLKAPSPGMIRASAQGLARDLTGPSGVLGRAGRSGWLLAR